MMLTVTVISENKVTGTVTRGKLNLVDLAGSERLNKSGKDPASPLSLSHLEYTDIILYPFLPSREILFHSSLYCSSFLI